MKAVIKRGVEFGKIIYIDEDHHKAFTDVDGKHHEIDRLAFDTRSIGQALHGDHWQKDLKKYEVVELGTTFGTGQEFMYGFELKAKKDKNARL